MSLINEAYEVLNNDKKRKEYNIEHNEHAIKRTKLVEETKHEEYEYYICNVHWTWNGR